MMPESKSDEIYEKKDWISYKPECERPRFYGSIPFQKLFEIGRIMPYQTIIVYKYYQPANDYYNITEQGMLEHNVAGGVKHKPGMHSPDHVLARENADNGWSADKIFG